VNTNQQKPRLAGAERVRMRADLRRKYVAGATIRGLAAETGRSYGTVRALLLEARTPMRGRGGRLPRASKTSA
jgi:hypothetical protein